MIEVVTTGACITPSAVALGSFDGVHRGHTALLRQCIKAAHLRGIKSCVYTFLNHPGTLTGHPAKLITSPSIKASLFETLGIDCVYFDRFTPELAAFSPEHFVSEILEKKLRAAVCVCGFHYHFGLQAAGDAQLLKALCKERGIEVIIVPPVTEKGEVISSSAIRVLIEQGAVDRAAVLLGRSFTLLAPVVEGKKLGRKLGFPTINQRFAPESIIPKHGVYESRLLIDGVNRRGVTNVGQRPTVSGKGINAETYILDYSGDLYGKMIEITFCRMLRPERKFASLEELKAQIAHDAAEVRG